MESSATLEETNRMRIELGIAPLGGPAAGGEAGGNAVPDKDQEAEENWNRRKQEEADQAKTKAAEERIAKARNKRELNKKLSGSTLGDESSGDTKAWLRQQKKRTKEIAAEKARVAKREKEEADLDALGRDELYTEKDLAGIKVSHDVTAFEEGEHILTLKDSRILDGEEDELMNLDLAGQEEDAKNIDLKRKKREYDGYDDEEFDPGMLGVKKKVLSKYDVDIEGAQDGGFRLGGTSAPARRSNAAVAEEDLDSNVNRTLLEGGLSYEKAREVSDYLQEGDVGFKKPKKKKKRSTRFVETGEDDHVQDTSSSMAVDSTAEPTHPPPPIENFVDDDELQAALARTRRQKSKKVVKLTPAQIAQQLAEQKAEEETAAAVERASASAAKVEDGAISFDDTSEFVRSIAIQPIVQVIRTSRNTSLPAASASPNAVVLSSLPQVKTEEQDVDLNAMMDVSMSGPGDEDEEEDEEDETLALAALRQGMSVAEMREKMDAETVKEEKEDASIGTAQEAHLGRGLAGALSLLKSTGNLTTPTADSSDRERTQKEKDLWLADRRRRLAQREIERIQARGGNKDQATREYENRMREQREASDALEAFKSYKPDINIVYHDEFGRDLTPKEAWKALSHKFHGKGSGKGKTDKRLAKIAQERKREAMTMGDTPSNMSRNFQERQERTGQAFMVLSQGNKSTLVEDSDAKGKKRK